ncbi:hypothetical protein C7401_11331 [Paraburkholderia unamae]|uniref:hypothetical protein n=1 Tax=Paraburkholderia unamae TaxID=219649 RepID=UPI000DC496D1|nr:hypothetical protein [Paraburkholderia unamae]RAR58299.1 hypothetical protein C7401_11331 [Paraburkholderia unamae]
MRTVDNEAVTRLLGELEAGSDDCWDVYEEVGRIVVARLVESDWRALQDIAQAWMASAAEQGRLADTPPASRDYETNEARANDADAVLCSVIVSAVFGAPPVRH